MIIKGLWYFDYNFLIINMKNLSQAEENYLKAIYKISENEDGPASTNAIAAELATSAAAVSDMVKRLSGKEKGLLHHKRHRGVTLTNDGQRLATTLVRKHRLWEVFLCKVLDFSWDEVHDIAEQLEHIQSPELVERLDGFLGHPKFDPHGDPIPDADGNFAQRKQIALSNLLVSERAVVVGVLEHSTAFLQYLDRMELRLGVELEMLEIFEFDGSGRLRLGNGKELTISGKVSGNLLVQKK